MEIANTHAKAFAAKVESWVKSQVYPDFTLMVKLDWSPSRTHSRGGLYKQGPGINIGMLHAATAPNKQYRYREYPSFDADRYIGGFVSERGYDQLEAIILHEIAHAIQFFELKKMNTKCTPHGPVFKHYYKLLREEFLNKRLHKKV